MSKLTIACTVAIAGIVGCGSERANSSPPEGPPGVDFQYNDRESSDSKATEAESSETEAKKPEAKTEEGSKTNVSTATRETGKSATKCEGLTQKKCEISDGCAWHTEKKCVAQ
jgi:hypothetical protein